MLLYTKPPTTWILLCVWHCLHAWPFISFRGTQFEVIYGDFSGNFMAAQNVKWQSHNIRQKLTATEDDRATVVSQSGKRMGEKFTRFSASPLPLFSVIISSSSSYFCGCVPRRVVIYRRDKRTMMVMVLSLPWLRLRWHCSGGRSLRKQHHSEINTILRSMINLLQKCEWNMELGNINRECSHSIENWFIARLPSNRTWNGRHATHNDDACQPTS